MTFKPIQKVILIFFSLTLCVGFRVYPNKRWQIETSSLAARKVFVTLVDTGQALNNNLPSSDPLYSSGTTLTQSQLLDSILSDFNSVTRSALILVRDTDSDFSTFSENHQIRIAKGSSAGASSGEANPEFSGGYITYCSINLTDAGYEDAKAFLALVTHELGHCVGLEHPQDTVNSVMSYFRSSDVYRLEIDDKMGLIHIYAIDPNDSAEKPTYGMSCSRR